MARVDTIVFDLDGTVLDSHDFTFGAFRHAVAPWSVAPSDRQIHAAFGPSERVILGRFVPSHAVDEAYARLQGYYRRNAARARPHDDMHALLDRLARDGRHRCLFTGRGGDSTRMLLAAHDLRSRFDAVVTGDSACAPKPSGEGILLLLARVGGQPRNTLVVGDSVLDLQAAADAGAAAIGVSWFTPTSFSGIESTTLTAPWQLLEFLGDAVSPDSG